MLPTHDEKLLLPPGEEMAVLGIRSAGVWWCAVVWGGTVQDFSSLDMFSLCDVASGS